MDRLPVASRLAMLSREGKPPIAVRLRLVSDNGSYLVPLSPEFGPVWELTGNLPPRFLGKSPFLLKKIDVRKDFFPAPLRIKKPLLGKGFRAGDAARTRDIQLGKLVLYQLSYTRGAFSIGRARARG